MKLSENQQQTVAEWRADLRREKQVQPRLRGERRRQVAETFRAYLRSARAAKRVAVAC